MSDMLQTALWYATHGFYVHPLRPNAKDDPLTKWGSEATIDAAQIRKWWQKWPNANVAIATKPSDLVVIDVDVKDGAPGMESWRDLVEELGRDIGDTVITETPSGGLHFWYRANGHTIGNKELAPGIDVRAAGGTQGGYVVAPPSKTPVGEYVFAMGASPKDIAIANLPESLAAMLTEKNEQRAEPIEGPIGKGERNKTLASLAGSMRQRGMGQGIIETALLDVNEKQCAPPLPENEVRKVAQSISRYEPERGNGGGPDKEPVFWDTEEMGTPRSDDYVAALNALGYHFRLDIRDDRVEVNETPITDVLEARIKTELRDYNYRHVNIARDTWITEADDHPYHPIRHFLESLSWDGEDHIGNLASYFDAENFELFFTRWVIGSVAQAYEMTQNRMLILVGPQDCGKSYFVRWLASPLGDKLPYLFVQSDIDPDNKDHKLRQMRRWIWEVAELGSTTRRADRESLKQFISQEIVSARPPYGRNPLDKPVLSNYIGTVNDEGAGFLNDPTGYRRYMLVVVRNIDWSYTEEVDMTQVWAQAKAYYDSGEKWRLNPAEAKLAAEANQSFEIEDPLEYCLRQVIEATGNPTDTIHTEQIKKLLHTYTDWRLSSPRAETMAVARVLKSWPGIEKKRISIDGVQAMGYVGVQSVVSQTEAL